jgi:hypothetical protein
VPGVADLQIASPMMGKQLLKHLASWQSTSDVPIRKLPIRILPVALETPNFPIFYFPWNQKLVREFPVFFADQLRLLGPKESQNPKWSVPWPVGPSSWRFGETTGGELLNCDGIPEESVIVSWKTVA